MFSRLRSRYYDLQLKIYRWYLSARRKQLHEELSFLESQNPESSTAIDSHLRQQLKEWLKSRLRIQPNWPNGHLALGQACLADDTVLAYSSAQAAALLLSGTNRESLARHLLGQTLIRSGQFNRAEEVLKGVLKEGIDNNIGYRIREELAACYIATGRITEAKEILAPIPKDRLSAEGHGAKLYVEGKERAKVQR